MAFLNTEKSVLDMQSINKYDYEGQIVCLFVGFLLLLLENHQILLLSLNC